MVWALSDIVWYYVKAGRRKGKGLEGGGGWWQKGIQSLCCGSCGRQSRWSPYLLYNETKSKAALFNLYTTKEEFP